MDKFLQQLVKLGQQISMVASTIESLLRAGNDAQLKREERDAQLFYLQLLTCSGNAANDVVAAIDGTQIKTTYTELYMNNTSNPVRVQVFVSLITAGGGIKLSLTSDGADLNFLDELALVANGKSESIQIVLPSNTKLYAKSYDPTNFPLVAGDKIRVRQFDPARLLSFGGLYPSLRT